MTPTAFIEKWSRSELRERQGAQEHFIDLCRLLGEPTPAEEDGTGASYCFERGATKVGGGDGWADVWRKGKFGWEYKGKHKDLNAALRQLQIYAPDLENPPYLVVSDMERIVVHTNWTNTVRRTIEFGFDDLREPARLEMLRQVFQGSDSLKPGLSPQELTAKVAARFGDLGKRLQDRKHDPQAVAHFLNRLIFCMFAEDAELLPKGLFTRTLRATQLRPDHAKAQLDQLFGRMRAGGFFGADVIRWFNGGLFDEAEALPLEREDLKLLAETAAEHDWSNIDPAVFGAMFEEALKTTGRRAALGAHYTDRDKILRIVEPVIIRPLTDEWDEALGAIRAAMEDVKAADAERRGVQEEAADAMKAGAASVKAGEAARRKKLTEIAKRRDAAYGRAKEERPRIGLDAVRGIEIEAYAAELARVTLWIGNLQWERRNGYTAYVEPILSSLDQIENRDALLNADGSEAAWPEADVIIGNPPFLGGKRLRDGLGDEAVERLFAAYRGRVPAEADLVCYWVEKAWRSIGGFLPRNTGEGDHAQHGGGGAAVVSGAAASVEPRKDGARGAPSTVLRTVPLPRPAPLLGGGTQAARAGLVTTNSIRGGANRRVLEPIAAAGALREAWPDEPWVLQGAAVRVSMIGFGEGFEERRLNGAPVEQINADLTGAIVDLTKAARLKENAGIAFMGDTKGGAFDIPGDLAREWLRLPLNPNGRPNSDVLKPWRNAMDVTRRPADKWIIDFGWTMSEPEAALYEAPFRHVLLHVQPERRKNNRKLYREFWWRHVEPRQGMWAALNGFDDYVVTPTVAKHRLFAALPGRVCPDHQLIMVTRSNDTMLGVLHSRSHELWSLRMGTWLGVGNDPRYTPSTTFETFPFPEGLTPNIPAANYALDPRAITIAEAAAELNRLRENWLNPSDLVRVEPEVVPGYPDRILPRDEEAAKELKKRTLTNLYNQRPAWLDTAHRRLDAAVAAAYGWPTDLPDDEVLARLFALNQERAPTGR